MSDKFFKKCNKKLSKLLVEAMNNPEKATDLMASATGLVAILMADTKTKNITLPAENNMSLILQMLPNNVIEATNKAFEEYQDANKLPVQ